MKNSIQLFGFLFILIFSTYSCSTDPCGGDKEGFLSNFDTLMEKIEDIDYDSEHKNWEAYNEQFKTYVKECYETYEDDMTVKEQNRFWKKSMTYYVKSFAENVDFEKEGAEIGRLVEENISKVSSELGDAIKNIDIDINLDDEKIEELLEEFGSDIEKMGEKWGKKLENILEKD